MVRERRSFWDEFKDEIESAHQSLKAGADVRYQLFAKGWFSLGQAIEDRLWLNPQTVHFGNPLRVPMNLQDALDGPFPHPVIFTAYRFLDEIVQQIKNAADWKTLDVIARPVIGEYSLHAGILYGIGESLMGDVVGLLSLAKLVALAGLYERIKHPVLMSFADPMTLALTLAVKHMG